MITQTKYNTMPLLLQIHLYTHIDIYIQYQNLSFITNGKQKICQKCDAENENEKGNGFPSKQRKLN